MLEGLGDIWPGRVTVNGENLGDVWPHPKLGGGPDLKDETAALVPFHKLSQWLAYSLIGPLEEAGVRVVDLDELTGLAEYRNGGLLIDAGLLAPRHDAVTRDAQKRPGGGPPIRLISDGTVF